MEKPLVCKVWELISQKMTLWERAVEARLKSELSICDKKYVFMPTKSMQDWTVRRRRQHGKTEKEMGHVPLKKADVQSCSNYRGL